MAKLIRTSCKKNNGIIKLKIVAKKLQKSLLLGKKSSFNSDEYEEVGNSTNVPEDVREGHVAVLAVYGDEPKRFTAPLNFLTHPSFMGLLEKAAEEYGFDREGALTIPCLPSEVEGILAEQWHDDEGDDDSSVSDNK